MAGHGSGALPIYLAAEHTFRDEGLEVEIVGFNGGAPAAQALASDSIDIGLLALSTLINLIDTGQPVKAFYAGFNQADFAWFGGPGVSNWGDLSGKTIAVASHGDLTDILTRYVLRKHGLEPERDVQVFATGGSTHSLQALKAGALGAAMLAPPMRFQAEADGHTQLGTQKGELIATWPKNVLIAKERMLDTRTDTLRAVARAVARAIRLAKADREAAVQAIIKALNYERAYAERAYDDAIGDFDERGLLPAEALPLFWQLGPATGQPSDPWPESRFLDRRVIDSLDGAAPR
ncbi:MAG TPA: ABC transporter substrate-binding protein [Gemmatimonadales bacterium]